MSVEALVSAVREVAARIGLELQWELAGDDDDLRWLYELHVVVERPGPAHSRYSTLPMHRFAAETLEQRQESYRIARAVAAEVGLPLHGPPIEDHGGWGESAWIRAQTKGPLVAYPLRWEASWWTDGGKQNEARGNEHVMADSGTEARFALHRRLAAQFAARPLTLRLFEGDKLVDNGTLGAPYPNELPPIDEIRAIALRSLCRAPEIAKQIVAEVPALSPRGLMVAFEDAFDLWRFDELAPLAQWRRGEIHDAELDREITPHVTNRKADWDRPRVLREAYRAGKSIAAHLREERRAGANIIQLHRALREAFDISFGDAKGFVDLCSDRRHDAELDAQLKEHPRS